jgi:hypothetical protein
MENRARLASSSLVVEPDRIRALEREAAHPTAVLLAGEETPTLVRSRAGVGGAVGSVPFAEDAARSGGLGAALALAARAPSKAVVGLVEGDPLAVLAGLALAGRKDGQAGIGASRLIATAVLGDP